MRHRPRPVFVLAWSLAGLIALVLVAAVVLAGLNAGVIDAGRMSADIILSVAVGLYGGTGLLIISRLPDNAIGWLLSLTGLSLAASMATEQYALYGVATAPGSVPAAQLAGWLAGTLASLTILLLFFLALLFPDGRLPSRRWRPLLWALYAVAAAWLPYQMRRGNTISGGITDALYSARAQYPNPLGFLPRQGWVSGLAELTLALVVVTGVLSVASVFARGRRAGPELRKQLAWLGYVGLISALWTAVLALYVAAGNDSSGWFGSLIWSLLALSLVAGTPVACAVAVLKYRLYEIDRIISRTLAYAILTGLLVGVYAGLVLLATQVLTITSPVAVAGSTLVAAALFSPLRSRVQRAVDHRFNRARYDADQMVTAFAARLKNAVDLDSVRDDLAGVVHQALEPAHISVWLSHPD